MMTKDVIFSLKKKRKHVEVLFKGSVFTINSLKKICDIIKKIEEQKIFKEVHLKGSFDTGIKLKDILSKKQKVIDINSYLSLFHDLIYIIENSKKIYKAFLSNNIKGPTLEIAVACDYRIAKVNSCFYFNEPSIGLMAICGTLQRLTRLIGPEKTIDSVLIKSLISYEKAMKYNLIHEKNFKSFNKKQLSTILNKRVKWSESIMNTFIINNAHIHSLKKGKEPAYKAIISSIFEGLMCGFKASLEIEKRWCIWLLTQDSTTKILKLLNTHDNSVLSTSKIFNYKIEIYSELYERLSAAYAKAGIKLLEEGYIAPLIENSALFLGFKNSPLATADKIGTDKLGDSAMKMYNINRKGKVNLKGFYDYENNEKLNPKLWKGLNAIFKSKESSKSVSEIEYFLLRSVSLEAKVCLKEGITNNENETDLLSIQEEIFPFWTGGPMNYLKYLKK